MESKNSPSGILNEEILNFIHPTKRYEILETLQNVAPQPLGGDIFVYQNDIDNIILFTTIQEGEIIGLVAADINYGGNMETKYGGKNMDDILVYVMKQHQSSKIFSQMLPKILYFLKENKYSFYKMYVKDQNLKNFLCQKFGFIEEEKNYRGQSILIKKF